MMTSFKGLIYIAAIALLAFVCHAAMGADASDGDATALAISVDANGDDTASIPDFDGDGTIGFGDFVIFAGVFGARQGDEKYDATHDLNGDGSIGFADFLIFAQNFGKNVPSPVVAIPDAKLRAAIEAALGKASAAPITQAEMATLDTIIAFGKGISDLTGLESAVNLKRLWLNVNKIEDISPVSGLTSLTDLGLGTNNITDIPPLVGLINLRWLNLADNNITDVSGLVDLTKLTDILLEGNNITDISPLSGLTNLESLEAKANKIMDISGLVGLTNLRGLSLRANPLSDSSINDHIPVLLERGVTILWDRFRVDGDFDIEFVFLVPVKETHKRVYDWVARRWMAVIAEDLPDYEFTVGFSGRCGDQSYEIQPGERIDDLRIYVTTFELEGGVVAWGSPRLLREGTHLPVVGCMGSVSLGYLNNGLHETGHVLGFGPVWHHFGLIQDLSYDDPNADTHFNGPRAIAAFDDAGGRGYTGKKVPVQKMDGAHWRSGVFWDEIMGPYGGDRLSAITVQSMAHLGYGVDVTQADPYWGIDARASANIAAAKPSTPGVDVTQADAYSLPGADPHWLGSIAGGLPLLPGDDRLRGHLARSPRAEPDLTCGATQMNEPIYVVDPRGHIVRTINR